MNFWWVNHNVTSQQEIEGGYLWSPKTMRNGGRSQFYENMRATHPGDSIVSFAKSRIGHVGTVDGPTYSAMRPSEFGRAGELWDSDGWRVPMRWYSMKLPFRPKVHIERLRPLLPKRYSPINDKGNGNQCAYLCKIDSTLFGLLMELGQTDLGEYASGGHLSDGQ